MKNSYHNLGRASAQMKFTKVQLVMDLKKFTKYFHY